MAPLYCKTSTDSKMSATSSGLQTGYDWHCRTFAMERLERSRIVKRVGDAKRESSISKDFMLECRDRLGRGKLDCFAWLLVVD
jgi:hypothetical protein